MTETFTTQNGQVLPIKIQIGAETWYLHLIDLQTGDTSQPHQFGKPGHFSDDSWLEPIYMQYGEDQ